MFGMGHVIGSASHRQIRGVVRRRVLGVHRVLCVAVLLRPHLLVRRCFLLLVERCLLRLGSFLIGLTATNDASCCADCWTGYTSDSHNLLLNIYTWRAT